jgi:outer membrane protein
MNLQRFSRILLAWSCSWMMLVPAPAQQLPDVAKPHGIFVYRSYKGTTVAPANLYNSSRIQSLLRSGNLYLTVQDAIALAVENNLNLQVQRYSLPTSDWAVERARAGGPIRGLTAGAPGVGSVAAGVGVLGAIQSAGVSGGGGGGNGFVGGGGGANIQQIGPVVVKFDPAFSGATTFSHLTYPQANQSVSQIPVLVDSNHIYSQTLSQGLGTGGTFSFQNYSYSQTENAPGDTLNPVFAPYMRASFQQPLAQNFGMKVNTRSIRVAQNGIRLAREQFRSNLLNLVNTVLGQYWGLVSGNEELKARQRALEIAQKFHDDTEREINAGALPRVQLPRAKAEVASRRQDVILAQASLQQQETLLKEQLVRTLDPAIEAAHIVPLDPIEVPERDDLPALRELVTTAMRNRPDVAITKLQDENALINSAGTVNGLLPVVIAYGSTQNRGFAGTPQITPRGGPNPYFEGGYGSAMGQIFRRNFPTEYGGIYAGANVHNRLAQADYGIEQLQLQASQLNAQKANNDIAVSIANQMVALQQARARYNAAINTRKLQEQLLAAEQEKFAYGTATFSTLIIDQRALVTAQISEVTALNAYARAHDGMEQVLGQTLDHYNISLEEGIQGRVNRESRPPDVVQPQTKNPAQANR